ncbi:MAG: hypothetical protein HON98_00325 [Chloroflexi bacterium]|jgi:hypothetical protein|nr:hypothetical protein [Chloroflexota bacterium]MBT4003954.1 hypothetical protein [Chloroflexota bacterium]MBT4305740.1 hypothetical protein [Chloroflexota bacterium]MBT4533564.1 hypothetical protein [Chloroflexota bacterium]MBT4681793.1 hypothetical protein [Chloroflexota bacterium]
MDVLTVVAVLASSILALYIGYVVGNYFPIIKIKKKGYENRELLGEKISKKIKSFRNRGNTSERKTNIKITERVKWIFLKIWFSEKELIERGLVKPTALQDEKVVDRQSEEKIPVKESISDAEVWEEGNHPTLNVLTPEMERFAQFVAKQNAEDSKTKEGIYLWYDRKSRKIVVDIDEEILELGSDLSQNTHSQLSMLIVDLQENVGLTPEMKNRLKSEIENMDNPASPDLDLVTPSFNPLKSIIDYVQADVPNLEAKEESIPKQINNIFQNQIEGTPLENLGISVNDWPNRGVVFNIGLDIYEEIDLIPDPEIQKAIKKAVDTWEKLQEE